ncbi:MAG: alpha-glucan family phosphorylase [Desulfomicrobium sp.]|nr:alpha-glucan family phosphorylase [Pseudomonadota bacterium]MBV1713304.1 alpha-glucan family phosphorylase [Desulfomicrobium sp.]MBU4571407.1 alpha-glucan family phosphorylase [Pseudomonadota bacterium]MBU4595670.1 alpha-glucan family phosphorylase [Pseudomonadota bacterium]MBV1720111.1 alpha-glucan family phosphorylase [Desulfomicrobium sp.]
MNQNIKDRRSVAYFSMEIGVDEKIRTYSGGLGVLAGDTIRSAADLRVPMVAVTLLYRKGYFRQRLEADGWQREEPTSWAFDELLQEESARAQVTVEGRTVHLRAWRYDVQGESGYVVPIYFLDADLLENSDWDRGLTHSLYGGDEHYRISQEVILGIGGVMMLRALGYQEISTFHLNEGHAALLTLALLDEAAKQAGRKSIMAQDLDTVRDHCVFTTHTPVPAGHDKFPLELARKVIGERDDFFGLEGVLYEGTTLNMTYLGLNLSRYVNGVARKHGEISRLMFAGYTIDAITNGVHAAAWVGAPFRELFDRMIPSWRQDNFSLRYALSIPRNELWDAHMQCKKQLMGLVNDETGVGMDENILTIGFARRAATYKRADLLFRDMERLKRISNEVGKIQIVYSGKAHPRDSGGKELIKRIFSAKNDLKHDIKVVYLENYNMTLGAIMTAGVDIWLNTPEPPMEASGTSGMKASLNGIPNLSVLDGWWIEGHIEGLTGWSIGEPVHGKGEERDHSQDAPSLYDKLEHTVVPLFYSDRGRFMDMMAYSIAINGSFFNTQRMVQEYVLNAYYNR